MPVSVTRPSSNIVVDSSSIRTTTFFFKVDGLVQKKKPFSEKKDREIRLMFSGAQIFQNPLGQ